MDMSQLAHYGVLGMKWGVRRAKKFEAKIAKHRFMNNVTMGLYGIYESRKKN